MTFIFLLTHRIKQLAGQTFPNSFQTSVIIYETTILYYIKDIGDWCLKVKIPDSGSCCLHSKAFPQPLHPLTGRFLGPLQSSGSKNHRSQSLSNWDNSGMAKWQNRKAMFLTFRDQMSSILPHTHVDLSKQSMQGCWVVHSGTVIRIFWKNTKTAMLQSSMFQVSFLPVFINLGTLLREGTMASKSQMTERWAAKL